MEKPWYEQVKSEADRIYEEAVAKIKDAVGQGVSFNEAVKLIDIKDEKLRDSIIDDALKVIIAEMHFVDGGKPLPDVAKALKLPLERLEAAKKEMLEDVEDKAREVFKSQMEKAEDAAKTFKA